MNAKELLEALGHAVESLWIAGDGPWTVCIYPAGDGREGRRSCSIAVSEAADVVALVRERCRLD